MSSLKGRVGWRRLLRLPAVALAGIASVPLGLLATAGATDWVIRVFCGLVCWSVGLEVRQRGRVPPQGCLLVSNHVGYLDVLALGRCVPARFLAMEQIAGWPLLGWLARCGGSVFVNRESPRDSRPLVHRVARRLRDEQLVVLFPEGHVSPDGRTLQPFRPMLFEACVAASRPALPVGIRYLEPEDPRAWAWIDEPRLWKHLWCRVLPHRRIVVEVRFGSPLRPGPEAGRKELAASAHRAVQGLLAPEPGGEGREASSPYSPAEPPAGP